MLLVVMALLNMILCGVGFTVIFNGVTIPEPMEILAIGAVGTFLYYGYKTISGERYKRADQLMMLVITFYISLFLSCVLYSVWTFDQVFGALSVTKVILFLLLLLSIYGNLLYIRAVSSYKKKRGNQRIKEDPKDGLWQRLLSKKQEEVRDVYLVLGESADNKE